MSSSPWSTRQASTQSSLLGLIWLDSGAPSHSSRQTERVQDGCDDFDRRAIKICETHNPESARTFKKLSKYDESLNAMLWKRLVDEGQCLGPRPL